MQAVVVTFNRHHNEDSTFQRMFPWNVRAILGSLEGRRLFKSNIVSKHTRQRLSICFCHQSMVEDDNRCRGTAPAEGELNLFHFLLQLLVCCCPTVQSCSFDAGKKNMFSISTYPNPFPEISSGCHEIKGSLSHQRDHTYLLWNLNRPYETLIYTRLLFCTVIVFLMCYQPQNNSSSLLLDESQTHTNLYCLFILNFS